MSQNKMILTSVGGGQQTGLSGGKCTLRISPVTRRFRAKRTYTFRQTAVFSVWQTIGCSDKRKGALT